MSILQADALLPLFCSVDDFCLTNLPLIASQLLSTKGKRNRVRSLSQSEIMTLLIAFQQSHSRNFKAFYLGFVCHYWKRDFPKSVSYNRFIEYIPSVIASLAADLKSLLGNCHGISFIDSTCLAVCHNKRINRHKVFAKTAKRGKTSVGRFHGFKLHLAINEQGELLALAFTAGNARDVQPVPTLLQGISGKVYGDKGYLSEPLRRGLLKQGIEIITKVRKNMKQRPLSAPEKSLLRKQSLVETVTDQIKNTAQIEHTRHRAGTGSLSNMLAALVAYCRQPKKPSIKAHISLS
ncbi:MAG: IS982 family transposase [Akkermansiaceae bacterium]|nr:IS982 family transposase [Armatimonadota bacterium]